MKKTCIILIGLLWLITATTYARTIEEAAQIASQFIGQKHSSPTLRLQRAAAARTMDKPVELAFTQYQVDNTTPAVYVFNGSDNGFVLISAEDHTRAVLGYSDNGVFNTQDIPENMRFWLQMYADELSKVSSTGKQLKKAIRRKATQEEYPTIFPILGETVWGQGNPFNSKCPMYSGKRTVTGCVATALSQIMYAHKYPTKGTGSHSYTTATHQLSVSANFGATTYDWANMIPNYNGSYTTTQAEAVATLMYHVGVAADMDYTTGASGSYSALALAAITEYFGYDKAIAIWPKDYMSADGILQVIASDLKANRPVYISGVTLNNEGHAFVCDGMNSDGYLHINWGWNGDSNGYFAISALDPESQGTGGSSSNLAFTENVTIYSNIQPDQGGVAKPLVTINKLTRTSGDAISKTSSVSFSLDHLANVGIITATGKITYFIYDNTQKVVGTVGIKGFELDPSYYYTNAFNISSSLPNDLANGEYELEIRYVDASGENHPILVKGLGEVRIPLTVTSSQFVFGKTPEAEVVINPVSHADITNQYLTNEWEIDLYSKKFWLNTPSETEVLMRFTINSTSNTSVIGTYILDPNNSGDKGTINANALYAVGYSQACYKHTPSDMHLTIIPNNDGTLLIEYYVVVNGQEFKHSFTTQELRWIYKESGTNKLYYYDNYVTYELASTLKASKAQQLTSALSHTDMTKMSYFVDGTISNMRNSAEQIAQYKTARFDISDDGSSNNQFYCYNTKWLGDTDFTTGNEIAVGDKVVVLGQLQNYEGNTPEIKGYIYEHTAKEVQQPIDYSIKNLQVATSQDTVFFNFESEAPYFHIKIAKEDGTTAIEDIIDFKNVYAKLADGNYTLWIRPKDEAKESYLADAVETTFTISTEVVDYSIHNLNITTEGSTAYFNWESNAPYFHIKITQNDGTNIINTIIDFKNAKLTDLKAGTYSIWIRPVDEAQEYYLADAVETTFTIETVTGIEDVTSSEMMYLYDMLGRLVDSKMSNDPRAFDVPQSGVYILNGKKVFIEQ